AELHQVVEEVENGDYTMTAGSDCSAPQRPGRIGSPRVVIIGHSAGGWIVSGYPGTYHDVSAMIQADINGSGAQPPPGTPVPPGPCRPCGAPIASCPSCADAALPVPGRCMCAE